MRSIPPPYRTVLPRREVMRALGGLALLGLAAGAAASPRLLILGDSLTAGFGLAAAEGFQAQLRAALQTHGRAVMLIDAAVSGDTCAGGRARLDWALADGADAALVELGGNDALRGTDPQECAADLAAILDTLAARHIPVLLSGMLAPPNLGAPYASEFSTMFDRLGTRPGVIYDKFFLADVAGVPALNQPDHIHPNAAGVAIIVARLLPLVMRLLDEVAVG